jgi:hypothetical protein
MPHKEGRLMPRTYSTRQSYAVPAVTSLAQLVAVFHTTRRASIVIETPARRVCLTLVDVRRRLTGEPDGRVELRAQLLRGARDISGAWLTEMAHTLGMTACSTPAQVIPMWTITGILAPTQGGQ